MRRRRAISMPCSASAWATRGRNFAGHVAMHHQRLGRVAHAQPLALGIHRDPLGHLQVGRAVDIHVAIAGEMLDDRHLGFRRHAANQASRRRAEWPRRCTPAAPGNARPLRDRSSRPVARRRRASPASSAACARIAAIARFECAASLPPRRITALPLLTQMRRGVGRHVRPRLVDEKHHAQRHAHLADLQAVGADRRFDDLADRLRQRRHFFQPHGHRLDHLRRQPQPVDLRRR